MINPIAHKACEEWYAYQNPEELSFCMDVVEKISPQIVLEIGTAYNASLACWAHASNPKLVIGIDPLELPATQSQKISANLLIESYNLKIIPFRSATPEAHLSIEKLLDGKKIDFLFIDAEHGYEDVKNDFLDYFKYLNLPSYVGFHDIFINKKLEESGTGVYRLWEKLKPEFEHYEIYNNSSMGIGIVKVDKVCEKLLHSL